MEKKDRAFNSFRHEMNDLVERFFGGEGSPSFPGGGWRQFIPRVDVTETDAEVCVRAELPGVAKEDLTVNISDSHMIIKGEKKTERKEEEADVYYMECSWGAFRRAIPLPCDVEADKAAAEYKTGVLTVKLPKSHGTDKSHKIPIQTE